MTLSLDHVQEQSVKRSAEIFPQCENWDEVYWSNAIAGEAGEHCNKIKKLVRDHSNHPAIIDPDNRAKREAMKLEAGLELADVVIYAAIQAEKLGLKLADLVHYKFNQKSQEFGSSIFLEQR
jgi:NTP pyrophosphatase (non-canonical NTP hydrolase)